MNKSEEITILKECASRLGPDSYCGPWLHERIAELESLIRSDIFPEITLKDAETRCREIVTAAEERAKRIKYFADEAANTAQKQRIKANDQACSALRQAIKTLENL